MVVEYRDKQRNKITLVATEYRTTVLEDVIAFIDHVLAPFHRRVSFRAIAGVAPQEEEEEDTMSQLCRLLDKNIEEVAELSKSLSKLSLEKKATSLGRLRTSYKCHTHHTDLPVFHVVSLVLSIGMGPMPAIVDLWGYDGQNCSCSSSSRSTPITQKQSNIKT